MSEIITEKLAYSVEAAAKASHVGRTLIYAELKSGRLRAKKIGRRTIITAEALAEWLNALPSMKG